MLSEFYLAMEWTTPRSKLFSTMLSSPSCSVHQVCTWWGFSMAAERHRIDAFIRSSARCRFVPPDSPSFETLCRTADEELFKNIITNNQHDSCRYRHTRHKTSISAQTDTTLNFRIVSVILVTVTLLRECCSLAFISI